MSARRPVLGFTALAAVAILSLAGCAGGPAGGAEKLSYEDSPLTKYLEPVNGSWDEERIIAEQKKAEEFKAECMAEEGFEYTPVDQSQNMGFMDEEEMAERETEEWVAANGWGFVQTQAEMDAQQAEAEEFVDPNQPYVESLSASEQEAYYATLYGAPPAEEELNEDGSYEYNWETAGCEGAAQHEIQGENYWEDEEFSDLTEAMGTLWEGLAKQPDMVALDEKWSACMADAEYPDLKTRNDAQTTIMDEQNAFWEGDNPEGPSEEQLAELKQKEIDIAVADFRCAEKLDYQNTQLKAQFALEEQFIDDNKSELEALLAAYSKGEE
ncbi:hypothetical protein [Agromyces sp. NPDC058064]|uniref:hypothetical protein n=1 Tax=Agromyces sp. NPDC058064 TaxID=3346322 RepID=UPI0036DC1C63